MPAGGQTRTADAAAQTEPMRPLATAQAVEEWASRARPGETFVYHSGAFLVQSLPAVTAARSLVDKGEAIFFQRKLGPGQYDYCIQKRANAERQLSAGQLAGRQVGTPVDAEDYERLMAVLRRLANFRMPCPPNAELAQLAKLRDARGVRYRLQQLESGGLIRITTPTDCRRVITILASGKSTARGVI